MVSPTMGHPLCPGGRGGPERFAKDLQINSLMSQAATAARRHQTSTAGLDGKAVRSVAAAQASGSPRSDIPAGDESGARRRAAWCVVYMCVRGSCAGGYPRAPPASQ